MKWWSRSGLHGLLVVSDLRSLVMAWLRFLQGNLRVFPKCMRVDSDANNLAFVRKKGLD